MSLRATSGPTQHTMLRRRPKTSVTTFRTRYAPAGGAVRSLRACGSGEMFLDFAETAATGNDWRKARSGDARPLLLAVQNIVFGVVQAQDYLETIQTKWEETEEKPAVIAISIASCAAFLPLATIACDASSDLKSG